MINEERFGIWGAGEGIVGEFSFSKTYYTRKYERGFKMRVLFCLIISLFIFSWQLQANVVFEDGLWHTINYTINDNVIVDYDKPGVGTTVEILNGGWIKGSISAYSDSHLIISGGIVDSSVGVFSNGNLSIYGGNIAGVGTGGYSHLEIYDGTISMAIRRFRKLL